ncbi:MAG: bifunctional (p)ppGpp synthetase/guanosine-3',5'-bis(diphosphate) 3'-pyrophosphohydrolase [Alphaproteobacteria bacterium]|nr:bifunctional (p)ppGpp synthetase/guanosine-3',5'-bis(diphosphate) 3'-pyrophosphohydrolase [Alphaproteobacteria bacterium]
MMRQYELVERVLSYDPEADEALLNRAYVYAMKAHKHQERANGDPYFSHPLEVAAIVTNLKLDDATVAAALLHDVIEDTDATRTEIDQLFGKEIGALVDGLTKIKRLDLVSKKAEQAENFRKLLVAISSDIRVLLVKLADRLHNMRTIEHKREASRKRTCQETLDIYAPLAGRMGMQAMRDELEDHAFRWLNPEAYETVTTKLEQLRAKNKRLVEEIRLALEVKLDDVGIESKVTGREKKSYSVWRKMQNKQVSLEKLSDIYGFRVTVNSVEDCYRVLGVIHTTWRQVPGRFKDYISTPKGNAYQSIHTTVLGPQSQRIELQIRTQQMHDIAEYGVAAHAIYKDAGSDNMDAERFDQDSGPYMWLRQLVETLLEGANSEEFLEHTKLELFQDQVFCFTPNGRLIALPRGATSVDFAYAVHTDIGNAAQGAYINGRQMPMDTRLRNGDEVRIVTAKTATPPAAWESVAVTGRARGAIRRAVRDKLRQQYSELGRRLVQSEFKKYGHDYSDDLVKEALPRMAAGSKSPDDVLASVARNEIQAVEVVKAALPGKDLVEPVQAYKPKSRYGRGRSQEGWFNLSKVMGLKFRFSAAGDSAQAAGASSIPLRGLRDDIPVKFADSGVVPGDRIVGVLTKEKGIRIFHIHSPELMAFEHEKWIDVTWDVDAANAERFPARIEVTALNAPGSLADIAQTIGETDGNIDQVQMVARKPDFTRMRIEVEVWDLDHLNHILNGLKAKGVVNSAERVFD